jgi:hypothetical protein
MKGVMKGCMQIIGALLALFLMPGLLQAKIPDNMTCSTCHTMHNSQDGLALNAVTPYGLLVSSCVACHTGSSGTSPRNTLTEAPAVMHSSGAPGSTSGTDNMLAGGSFYWVATGGGATDNTGHNVIGLAALDFGLGNVPPGGTALGSELTCAGTYGCHGVRDSTNEVAAIKGAHHTNDNEPLDGSTIGKSYRFLSSVIGTEDTDWEYTFASNDLPLTPSPPCAEGATPTIMETRVSEAARHPGSGTRRILISRPPGSMPTMSPMRPLYLWRAARVWPSSPIMYRPAATALSPAYHATGLTVLPMILLCAGITGPGPGRLIPSTGAASVIQVRTDSPLPIAPPDCML